MGKKNQKPAKVVLRLRLPMILVTNVVYPGESDRQIGLLLQYSPGLLKNFYF